MSERVIAAMAAYLVLAILVPKVIKEPTGIKVIDDIVLLLISQRGSLMSGTILIGIIVYLATFLEDYFTPSATAAAAAAAVAE
jgi:hypothetical protein